MGKPCSFLVAGQLLPASPPPSLHHALLGGVQGAPLILTGSQQFAQNSRSAFRMQALLQALALWPE